MDIILAVALIVVAFVAGLLVGRKNPSIATAAAKLAASGKSAADTAIADAKKL